MPDEIKILYCRIWVPISWRK